MGEEGGGVAGWVTGGSIRVWGTLCILSTDARCSMFQPRSSLTRAGRTRTSRPWSGMLTEMFQSSPNEHTTTPATATHHIQKPHDRGWVRAMTGSSRAATLIIFIVFVF